MRAHGFRVELNQLAGALILIAALVLTAVAYGPGLSGTLHFDDPHNLGGLEGLAEDSSVLEFVAQGTAGLFGRPIALASFAPQAYAWSETPKVFLQTNVCIHLLNGVLVVWLLYLLAIARGSEAASTARVAATAGALWMLSPLLVSSSLLIVQRMTLLAATFVLLGFIGYLYSRRLLDRRPRHALVAMTACLVVGTGLATLTKENGALLPLLVLVAEATVLPRAAGTKTRSAHRIWQLVFLAVPALALLGYLVLRFQYDEAVMLKRDFTAPERILTEARILWEYLFHALLPATSNLGPFHDDYPTYGNWLRPGSMLAVGGWLAAAGAAVALRRKFPIFAFAVGWYLVGHALESTTIPLELYFEHRNYVPLIGPAFALVMASEAVPTGRNLVRAGVAAYGVMLAIVLFNTASLWGRPELAAEMWAIHHPDSKRATQYLAQQLEQSGDRLTARQVLRSYVDEHPRSGGVAMQVLNLSCKLEPDASHDELVERVKSGLARSEFQNGVFEAIRDFYRTAEDGGCVAATRERAYELAATAAANPAFRASAVVHHNLHVLMSEEAFARRDLNLTMKHVEAALAAKYTLTTLTLGVQMLRSAGLYSAADEFVEEAGRYAPWHPIRAAAWRRQLAYLEETVDEAREQ